ncbi:MAG TPA: response regulator transcription factor [Terriglobales bacterium]|nr:response regulator transcription factor [Terriglobales bacterium]
MGIEERSRIFLLAQNRLLRQVLVKVLSKKESIQVVGSCGLTHDSVEEIALSSPDVLVIDSFTAKIARSGFAREIQQRLPDIRLVMIDMEPDNQAFLQAIRQGAMAYVLKDASALEVVAAVRTVAKGGAFCSPELCAFLFRLTAHQNADRSSDPRTQLGLTNREQQLVELIGLGLSNKEIANKLQLAEQTVRNQVHRMLRKLGATHRLEIIEICRTEGISI